MKTLPASHCLLQAPQRRGLARALARLLACACFGLTALPDFALAATPGATVVSGDARLVDFEYDEDKVFLVLTRPKRSTFMRFAPDEKISYVSTGDSRNFDFSVAQGLDFMEVKPRFESTETNATVVTSRRTYHLVIRSTEDGGRWYARVTWRHPRGLFQEGTGRDGAASWTQSFPKPQGSAPTGAASTAVSGNAPPHRAGASPGASMAANAGAVAGAYSLSGAPSSGGSSLEPVGGTDVRVDARLLQRLHFDYRVSGQGQFRPLRVFDDGTFTYVTLPDGVQDLPALFRLESEDGTDLALVHYEVKGSTLVVHRVMPGFVLKLGRQEVRVQRLRSGAWPLGAGSRSGVTPESRWGGHE